MRSDFGRILATGAALCGLLLAAACTEISPRTSLPPQSRPEGLAPPPDARKISARSADLAGYYRTIQTNLLTQGLLRTDGGGADTPFDAVDLARNFEKIVFYDEYRRSGGVNAHDGRIAKPLSRWNMPVRIALEFGDSVPEDIRKTDSDRVSSYAARLGRITGHSVRSVSGNANFHVFVAGEDDRDFLQARLKALVPGISANELDLFGNLPRSFYCLVVAVPDPNTPNEYTRAVALVRAEHPDLVRLSCFHEEIAQGLGLANDSPEARPSIFNDDDEFALLTDHDELLLKMLYDPRLRPGMSIDEARPVIRILARELTGEEL
ncbi:MAG: DUF2927 domain-containing protein [Pseudomonadota bacterium]|nr:DUF2927 domain-containing protein [Pseudomonadota bacterium]